MIGKIIKFIRTNRKILGISVVILLIMLVVVVSTLYLIASPKQNKNNVDAGKNVTICNDLTASGNVTSGTAPFAPTLSAAIDSTYYDTNNPSSVCEWFVNNYPNHDSYPMNGKCLFGGRNFYSKGTYTIKYQIAGQSCSKSIKITVN
jgi:hypothetical protein